MEGGRQAGRQVGEKEGESAEKERKMGERREEGTAEQGEGRK